MIHRAGPSPLRDRLEARLALNMEPEPSAPERSGERCWLARFGVMEDGGPVRGCCGRLVRAHLIPQQVLRREGAPVWDERAWVWACGGRDYGNAGHHGQMDQSRTLRVPRSAIPEGTEELAREFGLLWFLDRNYGRREA